MTLLLLASPCPDGLIGLYTLWQCLRRVSQNTVHRAWKIGTQKGWVTSLPRVGPPGYAIAHQRALC